MKTETPLTSIFDKHDKLEDPSGDFSWVASTQCVSLSDVHIIHQGRLQEVEDNSSLVHSMRKYAVTSKEMIRIAVRNFIRV